MRTKTYFMVEEFREVVRDVAAGIMSEIREEVKKYALLSTKTVLSVEEAALYLGVAIPTLHNYTCRRLVPFYKRGARCYFDRAELDAWMKQNRVATYEEAESEADMRDFAR